MIDSHCHLHYCKESPVEILNRCKASGIKTAVQVATDVETYQWGKELLDKNDLPIDLGLTVGLYPTLSAEEWEYRVLPLKSALEEKRVVAMGEMGLDLFRDQSYLDEQIKMLEIQIELALMHDLPIILHCREAYYPLYQVLKKYEKDGLKGVWHCFDGTLEQGLQMIELGYYISLSGLITFKNTLDLQNVVKDLPVERLLVETDSPYLSPVPKRGKPNEPSYVQYVLQYLAKLKGESIEAIDEVTTKNTIDLFKF